MTPNRGVKPGGHRREKKKLDRKNTGVGPLKKGQEDCGINLKVTTVREEKKKKKNHRSPRFPKAGKPRGTFW